MANRESAGIPLRMHCIQDSRDSLPAPSCRGSGLRGVPYLCLAVLLVAVAWSGSSGCEGKPAVVTTESLSFPVVLITGTATGGELPSRADVVVSKEDLGQMRVGIFSPLTDTTRSDPPIVIDSTGLVCEMRDLKGQRGGFWMMANPTGLMPITFTLIRRRESGIAAARQLITGCSYLGPDLDEERRKQRCERIGQAGSMDVIMVIIREVPESPPRDPGVPDQPPDPPPGP
jgi:hypothetical protein